MRRKLLPFYDERKAKVDMIVLHAVAFEPQKAVEVFAQYEVSSHYLIDEKGEIWQLVGEKHRARHAGVSRWQGREDINSRSIGIEFCSPTLGQRSYSKAQQNTAIKFLQHLIQKYKIKPENIVGHSDIAPVRKPDPGKAFFWQKLAENGIGVWYKLDDSAKVKSNDVAELLKLIGYDVSDVLAAACAFCRRFYPVKVKEISAIDDLITHPVSCEENLLADEEFLKVLKAVAYRYLKESKTPCKI